MQHAVAVGEVVHFTLLFQQKIDGKIALGRDNGRNGPMRVQPHRLIGGTGRRRRRLFGNAARRLEWTYASAAG